MRKQPHESGCLSTKAPSWLAGTLVLFRKVAFASYSGSKMDAKIHEILHEYSQWKKF